MCVFMYFFFFLHMCVIMQKGSTIFCHVYCHDFLLRIIIYIFWQVTQGRKQLIGLLRQQIVNVSVF